MAGCATSRTRRRAWLGAACSTAGRPTRSGSETGTTDRDDLTRYALIAAHEREAGRPAEAAAASLEAADRAEAVYANREAIDHLEAAVGLGGAHDAAIHVRIGELRARLGEYPAAIAALETAAALAAPDDLPAIEIALGGVHRRRGDLAAAASHLDAALATPGLPRLAPGTRPRRAERGRAAGRRPRQCRRGGAAARDLATASATRTWRASPNGSSASWRSRAATRRRPARPSSEASRSPPTTPTSPPRSRPRRLSLSRSPARARSTRPWCSASEPSRRAGRIGDRHLEAAVENHLADLLHEAGREDLAMEHLKRAVTLFAEIGEGAGDPDPGIWTLAAW